MLLPTPLRPAEQCITNIKRSTANVLLASLNSVSACHNAKIPHPQKTPPPHDPRPTNPTRHLRLPQLPRQPSPNHRHHRPRQQRIRADAHRWRQIPVLPNSRPDAPRCRHHHLPAHRPDGRPSRQRPHRRHPRRRRPQRHTRRHHPPNRPRHRHRQPETALRLPRAAHHRKIPTLSRPHHRQPICPRRSPLRQPMGARLSPRIPTAQHPSHALSPHPPHRAHRHRRCPNPRRHQTPFAADRCRRIYIQLRPPQHPLSSDRTAKRQKTTAGFHPKTSRRAKRHRLLPKPQKRRRHRPIPMRQRAQRLALPRRLAHPNPQPKPTPLHPRRKHHHRRHRCLWHGHRQTRRALRCPSGYAAKH